MTKYKVGYITSDGRKKAFYFESDKSFRTYHKTFGQGILGLGTPITDDLMKEALAHESFRWDKVKFIKNMDTNEIKVY